jgi:hypothetical protein
MRLEASGFRKTPFGLEVGAMRFERTAVDTRVSGRVADGRKAWRPSKEDVIEQEIALRAADSDRFDHMDDEQWCSFLRRMSHAGT